MKKLDEGFRKFIIFLYQMQIVLVGTGVVMIKVLVIFGTRPEAIKMCPVVKELKRHSEIEVIVCTTGQHREMIIPILETFLIEPQYDFHIMRANQTLFNITETVLTKMQSVLHTEMPTTVMVHGDTTSALAAAMACFYMGIPVCHVEAGLRTYNHYSPYPEEFNRSAIDAMTDIFFAPTEGAKNNLLKEGKKEEKIYVTGNTVIDALKTTVHTEYSHEVLKWAQDSRLILLTAHRRENIGASMRNIFSAIKEIVNEFEDVKVVYPVHLNPGVQEIATEIFGDTDRIKLIDPLDVIDFHNIMSRSYLIVTDSGGIQEEAPSLGKPVLVIRNTTERPEGVAAGTLRLVGTEKKGVKEALKELLTNEETYCRMAMAQNPYGDGKASERIVQILLNKWGN